MTDTLPYDIIATAGELEFRSYPAVVLATVDSPEDYAGFRLLFAYITGYNRTGDTLPMTSPVITSLPVTMTPPVVSDATLMSFVLPPGMNRDRIPDPLDSRIRVTTLPGKEVAVVRFPGYARPHEVAAAEVQLREALRDTGAESAGTPFLMRYHPPWTPGFLRRNEVGVEINRLNQRMIAGTVFRVSDHQGSSGRVRQLQKDPSAHCRK